MILQIDSYPEARRRCTGQPVKATLRWSSCCWSRAPPWRKRTNSAGAPGLNGFARMGWVEIRFHLRIAELQNKKSETRSRCLFFWVFHPLVCIWMHSAFCCRFCLPCPKPEKTTTSRTFAWQCPTSSEIWLRFRPPYQRAWISYCKQIMRNTNELACRTKSLSGAMS